MMVKEIHHSAALYCEAVRYFESEGVSAEIIVETHGSFVTSALVQQMCDSAGQGIPLLWDTHHTWKIGGESPTETYEVIAPLVRHIHGKDSVTLPSETTTAHPYRYAIPGKGEYPFAELFATLADTDDTLPDNKGELTALSLEWELMWHRDLPPLDPALRAWMQILKQHISLKPAE
jgi:sugar phosphate isomerase/epimerase